MSKAVEHIKTPLTWRGRLLIHSFIVLSVAVVLFTQLVNAFIGDTEKSFGDYSSGTSFLLFVLSYLIAMAIVGALSISICIASFFLSDSEYLKSFTIPDVSLILLAIPTIAYIAIQVPYIYL